jgi:nitrite reductase (NADH) large subunit
MNSAAQPLQHAAEPEPDTAQRPVVIVGNGPVGMRVASELLERLPGQPVVIFGDEPHEPYNRVRLSSWLAGEIAWREIAQPLRRSPGSRVDERVGYRVAGIDRAQRQVFDDRGQVQAYRKLVLATGSTPFVPAVPGIDLPGVFTFRDLDDTNRLIARRARSHHTVVIGGGLLGLEAARGMQRANTRVTVIEHADRLLGQQLDEAGSSLLQKQVEALGIRVMLEDGLGEVLGRGRVEGIRLRSGLVLACDTVVVAAGIRPNIALARSAKLAFGRGVRVDDRMRTSDPDIYAVGECAEHRDRVYGLVAPGLEQAAVAAADIAGTESHYGGSVAASRLKVVGTPVFSMGPMGAGEDPLLGRAFVFRDPEHRLYRKILVHRHRLVGAIGIGTWDETLRLQTTIGRAQRIWPWQVLRFIRSGRIWPAEDSRSVAAWPAASIVCQCTGVTRGAIGEAITLGACDADAVAAATGAGGVCGSCRPLVNELLGGNAPLPAVPMHRGLLAGGLFALTASLVFAFAPPIPYANSVQHDWHWDVLWRDGLVKQISGFSVLGLLLVALLLSLRKRTPLLDRLGRFDAWRLVHIVLGVLVIAGLFAHTGLRLGSGLNLLLMASFGLMLLLGAVSTGVIALEHRIGGSLAQRLRRQSLWLHILLFWPVPALLGWHVFKTYWF